MDSNILVSNLIYASTLPLVIVSLCIIVPISYLFNSTNSIYQRFLSVENLKGKVVLITGASSGIGEQLAYAYARKGASLTIVARRESQLQKVADVSRELGSPDVLPICADVTNVKDCQQFVTETVNHFGRLDHLVNNAGIINLCALEDADDVTKFTPVMDVNFWGSVYPTYYAIPHLKKTKGKIVVNASTAAVLRPPKLGFSTLYASKAAALSFYDALRVELAPAVTVTTITLGVIETEMTRGKHLTKDGDIQVKQELIEEFLTGVPGPIMSSRACAEAIVGAVRRGVRNITEPKWFKLLILLKIVCPEIVDWYYRNFS